MHLHVCTLSFMHTTPVYSSIHPHCTFLYLSSLLIFYRLCFFLALAEAAPPDFGIVQLFNSNEETMDASWRAFKQGKLWAQRYPRMAGAYWSTCAYMIDREIMRPYVDGVLRQRADGWLDLKVGGLQPTLTLVLYIMAWTTMFRIRGFLFYILYYEYCHHVSGVRLIWC
jgi:hypothetical protein